MKKQIPCQAFTKKFSNISLKLFDFVKAQYGDKTIKATALWDTGAMRTCISTSLASQLLLPITGKMDIRTPSGLKTVNTYLIDIPLPNDVTITDMAVCDSDIGVQGLGVLIGMDIISRGDFAVSNYQGKTVFSFRIPSQGETNYVTTV